MVGVTCCGVADDLATGEDPMGGTSPSQNRKGEKGKGARRKENEIKTERSRGVRRGNVLQDPDRADIRQRDWGAGARLLLRLLDFGAGSGHVALGHVSGQTTDVILQELVFTF